jgi:hypothetical protein
MYVGRVPLLLLAMLVSTALSAAALAIALSYRARVWAVIAPIAGPLLTCLPVHWLAATAARPGRYDEAPATLVWIPPIAAALLVAISIALFPQREGRIALRYRFCFVVLALGFAMLNCINWCAPGWCGRFGFPLTYSWFSDGVLVVNGESVSVGWSSGALASNIIIAAVAAAGSAAVYRRQ